MIDQDAILKLSGDVRYRVMDDEAVIVCQNSGEILAVNDIGREVLDAAGQQASVGAILKHLGSKYDVAEGVLNKDVLAFIEEMLDAGVFQL